MDPDFRQDDRICRHSLAASSPAADDRTPHRLQASEMTVKMDQSATPPAGCAMKYGAESSEISFVDDFLGAGTDLEGLYAYDTDGDGFLTAADNGFSDFLVWKDGNGNGRSEKQELLTLDELGIVSIGLERRNVAPLDRDAQANQIIGTSTFETVDGRTRPVGDVALFVEMRHSYGIRSDIQPLLQDGYFMT